MNEHTNDSVKYCDSQQSQEKSEFANIFLSTISCGLKKQSEAYCHGFLQYWKSLLRPTYDWKLVFKFRFNLEFKGS